MKAKKIITLSLTAALAIGALTANGVIVSADAEKGTIKVAASATPHAEILEEAKPLLEAEGWDLEVTVFDDYVQPKPCSRERRFRCKLLPAYPIS